MVNFNFGHFFKSTKLKFCVIKKMERICLIVLLVFCHLRLGFSTQIRVLKFDPINGGNDTNNLQVKIDIDPRKNYSKVTTIGLLSRVVTSCFSMRFWWTYVGLPTQDRLIKNLKLYRKYIMCKWPFVLPNEIMTYARYIEYNRCG